MGGLPCSIAQEPSVVRAFALKSSMNEICVWSCTFVIQSCSNGTSFDDVRIHYCYIYQAVSLPT